MKLLASIMIASAVAQRGSGRLRGQKEEAAPADTGFGDYGGDYGSFGGDYGGGDYGFGTDYSYGGGDYGSYGDTGFGDYGDDTAFGDYDGGDDGGFGDYDYSANDVGDSDAAAAPAPAPAAPASAGRPVEQVFAQDSGVRGMGDGTFTHCLFCDGLSIAGCAAAAQSAGSYIQCDSGSTFAAGDIGDTVDGEQACVMTIRYTAESSWLVWADCSTFHSCGILMSQNFDSGSANGATENNCRDKGDTAARFKRPNVCRICTKLSQGGTTNIPFSDSTGTLRNGGALGTTILGDPINQIGDVNLVDGDGNTNLLTNTIFALMTY